MSIVKVKDLVKIYSEEYMLDKVSFEIEKGSFFAVIGKENSGKTPLLEILAGLKFPNEGEVRIFGKNMSTYDNRIKKHISFVPDNIIFYENITALELFARTTKLHSTYNPRECVKLCKMFNINMDNLLLEMSYDENKCVALVNSLMTKPKILILDEPYNYLSCESFEKLMKLLKIRSQQGVTIIFACERYEDVKGFCDSYIYLKEGDLIKQGNIDIHAKTYKMVTVEGCSLTPFHSLNVIPVFDSKDKKRFVYGGDMTSLAGAITKAACKSFLVEELTLEEVLLWDFERWK